MREIVLNMLAAIKKHLFKSKLLLINPNYRRGVVIVCKKGIVFVCSVLLIALFSVSWCFSAVAYAYGSKGCKVLIVYIGNSGEGMKGSKGTSPLEKFTESNKLSEVSFVKESLDKGGRIVLSPEAALQIDKDFVSKYAVKDSNGYYFIHAALLNFVGGHGWYLTQVQEDSNSTSYYFVKER
jgi:hypothetical protein